MDDSSRPARGLFGSLRRLADTLLSAVLNRVELFAVEFHEEKQWLVATLIWCAAAIFFAATAVLLILLTILFFCPEPARPWVLLGFSAVFVGCGTWCGLRLRRQFTARKAFSSTLQELEKDIEWLRSAK